MMRVTVLDDYQGVVARLDATKELGGDPLDLRVITERIADEGMLIEALRDADCVILIRERTRLTARIIEALPALRLIVGPAGLLWLNLRRHPQHGDAAQKPMDRGFIALLLLTSLTGLALLAGRDTGAMGLLLAAHLGAVMALFLTMPYGKFAHGIYRTAALLKWAIEKRRPNPVGVASE